jgi:putative methionine-R-sulfoxide reductase with GAF domain
MIETQKYEFNKGAASPSATLLEGPEAGFSAGAAEGTISVLSQRWAAVPVSRGANLGNYALGLAAVAGALAFTMLLRPLFPYPFFFFFFPAVIGAAWFGGMGAGLFAVLVSTLAVDYFLTPPLYSLAVKGTDLAYFAAFVACSLAVTWISSKKKEQQDFLVAAHGELAAQVAEHSAELHKSQNELMESERGLQMLAEVIPNKIWSGRAEAIDDRLAGAPLPDVLAQIVQLAASLVKCDSCFIYMLEDDELILRASKNPHPEIVDRLKLKIGQGITGWVAEHREPVVVAKNASEDARFRFFNELPEDRFESFLSVPILSRGRVVGVINVQNRAEYRYNEREIRVLSTIGFLVGAEIEMARLDTERSHLSQKLAERKVIDRAKGILQKELRVSEEEAYLTLQRESRKRGKPMKDIAESILLNEEIRQKRT